MCRLLSRGGGVASLQFGDIWLPAEPSTTTEGKRGSLSLLVQPSSRKRNPRWQAPCLNMPTRTGHQPHRRHSPRTWDIGVLRQCHILKAMYICHDPRIIL